MYSIVHGHRAVPHVGPTVEYIEGDFGNRGDVKAALDGCRTVFHLVGTTLPKTSNDDPVHDLESNLVTTVRFLEEARHHGVKKIVFASSGGTVYGVPTTIPIPEDHKTDRSARTASTRSPSNITCTLQHPPRP